MKSSIKKTIDSLRKYNAWRRGEIFMLKSDEHIMHKAIGKVIDAAIASLYRVERKDRELAASRALCDERFNEILHLRANLETIHSLFTKYESSINEHNSIDGILDYVKLRDFILAKQPTFESKSVLKRLAAQKQGDKP